MIGHTSSRHLTILDQLLIVGSSVAWGLLLTWRSLTLLLPKLLQDLVDVLLAGFVLLELAVVFFLSINKVVEICQARKNHLHTFIMCILLTAGPISSLG